MIRSEVFVGTESNVKSSAGAASFLFDKWVAKNEAKIIRFISITTNTTIDTVEYSASHIITVVFEMIDETE